MGWDAICRKELLFFVQYNTKAFKNAVLFPFTHIQLRESLNILTFCRKQNTLLSNKCTNIQFVDTIRIIIKYLKKIFKIAPTCFGSQGINHQGAL